MKNCGLGKTKRYNKRMDGPYFSIFLKYEILLFFEWVLSFIPQFHIKVTLLEGGSRYQRIMLLQLYFHLTTRSISDTVDASEIRNGHHLGCITTRR